MIQVQYPGVFSTIQDLGRRGNEIFGMPRSGSFDPFLASVANRLVGNALDAAVLEFALAGPTLVFDSDALIAICGYGIEYSLGDSSVESLCAIPVRDGETLQFRKMQGWFGYLAVAGGFRSERVLGSASTYAAGHIGGRLEKGSTLEIESRSSGHAGYRIGAEALGFRSVPVLRILEGMHIELFSNTDLQMLSSQEFRIEPNSDRMGIELSGPELRAPRVTRSVPAFRGSMQILPSGHPLVLGPDGPTTGGYPQAAMLASVSWTSLAQWRPGVRVRLQWTTREDALQMRAFRDALFRSEEAWQAV